MAAFQQGLQELGWSIGRNLRIDYRWGPFDRERGRQRPQEFIAFAPDVMMVAAGHTADAVQRVSRTVPVVLAQSIDPVGAGYVASLSRPGGNVTGFTQFEYSLGGKWLQLLKELAPDVTHVGVIRDLSVGAAGDRAVGGYPGHVGADRGGDDSDFSPRRQRDRAWRRRIRARPERRSDRVGERDDHRSPGAIVASAARHRVPAVYPFRYFAAAGGLISYGADLTDQYRRAAGYVDRILKGEKPADLPVQRPTKYDLMINLKTAKALGLPYRRPCSRAPTR